MQGTMLWTNGLYSYNRCIKPSSTKLPELPHHQEILWKIRKANQSRVYPRKRSVTGFVSPAQTGEHLVITSHLYVLFDFGVTCINRLTHMDLLSCICLTLFHMLAC